MSDFVSIIERTWAAKFWPDRNFTWYLVVTEVNAALAYGHFRKGGRLIPNLQFRRKLAHEMMENTIWVDTVDSGRPRRLIRHSSYYLLHDSEGKKVLRELR